MVITKVKTMDSGLLALLLAIWIPLQSFAQPNEVNELNRTPDEIVRLLINDLLTRPDYMVYQTPGVSALHYAEICAAYGAVKVAGQLNDRKTIDAVIARYNDERATKIPNTANHVDANVYGILPLEIFIQTNDSSYLEKGMELAGGQWKDPLPNGMSAQTRYWIDDIYMIGCLQVQAYRATGQQIYLDRAALEIDSYIKRLQQPNGLFFHGPDAPFFWGRGNGWVAAGLAELLSELPETNPHYQSILDAYLKMMNTLVKNQSEDGMWHQVIDKTESFKETSSTAMFGYAMAQGIKKDLLPEIPYRKAYMKAWNALMDYINDDGKVREVCVGTGQSFDINYYFYRPRTTGDFHGQAPMLWFANVLMNN